MVEILYNSDNSVLLRISWWLEFSHGGALTVWKLQTYKWVLPLCLKRSPAKHLLKCFCLKPRWNLRKSVMLLSSIESHRASCTGLHSPPLVFIMKRTTKLLIDFVSHWPSQLQYYSKAKNDSYKVFAKPRQHLFVEWVTWLMFVT